MSDAIYFLLSSNFIRIKIILRMTREYRSYLICDLYFTNVWMSCNLFHQRLKNEKVKMSLEGLKTEKNLIKIFKLSVKHWYKNENNNLYLYKNGRFQRTKIFSLEYQFYTKPNCQQALKSPMSLNTSKDKIALKIFGKSVKLLFLEMQNCSI